MSLKPGARMRSQVCDTQVMVIRPSATVELTCGGHPMIDVGAEPEAGLQPVDGLADGNTMGKRYTAEADAGVEVLVTKAGAGTLGDGTTPLVLKDPKPLPSSD